MGLDGYEFILWVEKKFNIDIPNRDTETIFTVDDLAKYLASRLLESEGLNAPTSRKNFPILQAEISKQFNIPLETIKPESSFVKDLKID